MLRTMISAGLRKLPGKDIVLRLGAAFPAPLRGAESERIFGAITRAGQAKTPLTLTTNLGMQCSMPIQLPSTASATYLFGTAAQYFSERRTLALACELAADARASVDIGANYGYFTY